MRHVEGPAALGLMHGFRVAGSRAASSLLVACVLVACGGGDNAAEPVALPAGLSLSVPASAAAVQQEINFGSSAADTKGLSYRWDFGDGSTSHDFSPRYRYGQPGSYRVTLTVTNDAGESVNAASVVDVADLVLVQGRQCSGAAQTGWCWQQPLPQGNLLRDYAGNGAKLWAVGDAGTILHSPDGGTTWRAQVSPTRLDLAQVKFVDEQVGWVAGSYGELARTIDGGSTWKPLHLGRSATAVELQAVSAQTAMVRTYDGNFITADGGTSWQTLSLPPGAWSVQFKLQSDAALYAFAVDRIWRSADRGKTWQSYVLSPAPEQSREIISVHFTAAGAVSAVVQVSGYDASLGWYTTRPWLYTAASLSGSWSARPVKDATLGTIQQVDAQTLFYFGPSGDYRRTMDGGLTSVAIQLPKLADRSITRIEALSDQRLLATDQVGGAYASSDSGASWRQITAGAVSGMTVNSVRFFDARNGLAISSEGGFVRTSDGGLTWRATMTQNVFGWRRMQFLPDNSVGWVISDSGTIFRTTDQGRTWLAPVAQTSVQLTELLDFHFVTATQGWAVTSSSWSTGSPSLHKTTDGGQSWTPVEASASFGHLTSVRFADAQNGVAFGHLGFVLATTDGGATWSPRSTGHTEQVNRMVFVGSRTLVAVGDGGVVLRSADLGVTWARVPSATSQPLRDLQFVSEKLGFAVGDGGTLLRTEDGGLTWPRRETGTSLDLQGLHFLNPFTGWVVGRGGAILVTVFGG